jgi:hypothetical protein
LSELLGACDKLVGERTEPPADEKERGMEFEIEFKLNRGWTFLLGLAAGLGIGYLVFGASGAGESLQETGGELMTRARRAIGA